MKAYSLVVSVLLFCSLGAVMPAQAQSVNDFNLDNRSDLAVYNPANGQWFIRSMTGAVLEWARAWGYPTAVPVPADYDGDGQVDLAVYDRNGGYWYVLDRSGRLITWAFNWGWSTAVPVPVDFDGDGSADFGVYDTETGNWYVYSREKQQILHWATPWGFKGDVRSWERPPNSTVVPTPYDYDRDGRADMAIYYRGYGMPDSKWFVNGTTGKTWFGIVWGSSGSIPAPGSYRGIVDFNNYPGGVSTYKVKYSRGSNDDGTFNTPYMHQFKIGTYGRTLPVAAHDFDNNDYDDHAVYDYLSGRWTILLNDEDGNGAPPDGQVYQQPPRADIAWGFSGAIPANIYSTILSSCGYTLKPW